VLSEETKLVGIFKNLSKNKTRVAAAERHSKLRKLSRCFLLCCCQLAAVDDEFVLLRCDRVAYVTV
jgi:hypothetical protein